MREMRINLTTPEIRAYQAGERTLRRRVTPMRGQQWLKPETLSASPGGHGCMIDGEFWWQFYHPLAGKFAYGVQNEPDSPLTCIRSPFGSPGDRLMLTEKWASPTPQNKTGGKIAYDADGVCGCWFGSGEDRSFICHGRVHQASGYHECFPKEGARTWGLGEYTDVRSGEFPSYKYGWRASQSMPTWAARYTPTVRSVRVEQVNGVWWWVAEVEG